MKEFETLEVIPDPISLIESMRAVGYSVEAAIADLVDNSISAKADEIEIKYDASDDPFVAILDNGWGMGPDALTNAMRHGSHNPSDERLPDDLGRFGLQVPPRDPFLRNNTFRQPLEGQLIKHERGGVQVSPFILPPVSHLSPEEISLAGGREGLRGTQGFYIYRNRRLVIWGTWFRLVPKEEFYKLTRVQVDIPNSFDDLWALDIKKSVAYPPETIRRRLKELIPHFANTSKKTVTYPGRKQTTKGFVPLWVRVEPQHGSFRYEINLEHPVIQSLSSRLAEDDQRYVQMLLSLFGDTLPLESIYADMCADRRDSNNEDVVASLLDIATNLLEITGLGVDQIMNIDPIVRYPQHHEKLRVELDK